MKIIIIGLLIAGTTIASAQGLLGSRSNRRPVPVHGQEARELAARILAPEMQTRIKRIIGEPTPLKLEECPFREAVLKAKTGDAEGYFELAYHYAVGKEVACDPRKANLLLRRSADMNHPMGTLVLAVTEELRLHERDDKNQPDVRVYLSDIRSASSLGNLVGTLSLDEAQELLSKAPFYRDISPDSFRRSFSNATTVAYVMGLYEKAVGLMAAGAKAELSRFESCRAELEAREGKADRQSANARFAEEELGIPAENGLDTYNKLYDEKVNARHKVAEERLEVVERLLREKGVSK